MDSMRNCCYMAAICIAVWLFYAPAHSEPGEPNMQDDHWYDVCVTLADGSKRCATLLGKDVKALEQENMKRGGNKKMEQVPPQPPGRIPGPDGRP
jgi:hypothetical protein